MPAEIGVCLRTAKIPFLASRRAYEVDEREDLGHARPVDELRYPV
jgi:hypothetical protein